MPGRRSNELAPSRKPTQIIQGDRERDPVTDAEVVADVEAGVQAEAGDGQRDHRPDAGRRTAPRWQDQ
jgi:hypothetical protein